MPPNKKSATFGKFTLLRDSEGDLAIEHIQTTVKAKTPDEAKVIARKEFEDFFTKLTVIFDSRFSLREDVEVTPKKGKKVVTPQISTMFSVTFSYDVMGAEKEINKLLQKRVIRKTPLKHYRDAIDGVSPFEQFKDFYKVLEFYFKTTAEITSWIQNEKPDIQMKKDRYGKDITVLTWIRHKLSHSRRRRGDLKPLSISNPRHVKTVKKYLPVIQELSSSLIHQREGISKVRGLQGPYFA